MTLLLLLPSNPASTARTPCLVRAFFICCSRFRHDQANNEFHQRLQLLGVTSGANSTGGCRIMIQPGKLCVPRRQQVVPGCS